MGGYDLLLGGDSEKMTPLAVMNECLRWLPKALLDKKSALSFTATISMQMLIELFGDCFPNVTRDSVITLNDIRQCRAAMPDEEFAKRSAEFEEKYFDK